MSMLYRLYRGATAAGGPVIDWYLKRREQRGKEDGRRAGERRGIAGAPRPAGKLVWVHGASVGEAVSALSLIERLVLLPEVQVLVTTGTVTSAAVMARRLPPRALHQYIPVDRPGWVASFLDHWRPDLALWLESDLWPNMLAGLAERGIPAALVNARLSARSFERWQWVSGTIRRLLSTFSLCLAQGRAEAERYSALGMAEVQNTGNLKYSAVPPPVDEDELARLRSLTLGRPIWLAASFHPEEDGPLLDAHEQLAGSIPGLLTVLCPRHPQRGEDIAAMAAGRGIAAARRSLGEEPSGALYIADTLGEMGTLYRWAPVSFIGGSFAPRGGQNPIEPALLGSAILFGPSRYNFAEVTAELEAAGGLLAVADAGDLAAKVDGLLVDPAARERLVSCARNAVEVHRGTADRVMQALAPLFARAGIAGGAR
ncbi:3-deoxy-D-manno-octulosonic acid transferase [Radicibacter daui]|uniref:3-deoxy-D-manno-octulosonic acid transferase n=1 Tax=Radicibacter daui TaxID=3064829 RepID=UPI004046D792